MKFKPNSRWKCQVNSYDINTAKHFNTKRVEPYKNILLKQQNEQLQFHLKRLQNQLTDVENKTQTYNNETVAIAKKWEDVQKLIQDKTNKSVVNAEMHTPTLQNSVKSMRDQSVRESVIIPPTEPFQNHYQQYERPTMHYQFEKNKQHICIICHQYVEAVTINGECQLCLKQKHFFSTQREERRIKKQPSKNDKRKYQQAGYEKALREIEKYEKMDPGLGSEN